MKLPPDQQAIRDKCFHPSGKFVEFPLDDLERSIPERFEKIARLAAGRIAIKTKDDHLTYDQLNRSANRIARVILNLHGGGQTPVALFLEHGMWPIVVHMAVVKAGKMSLQLDPAASCDRLSSLLKESHATLIVTNIKNFAATSQWENNKVQLINVDNLDPDLSDQNLELPIDANSYAYIRYTSGSTGNIKGALKTHRHILHAVMNLTNDFHICGDDRMLLLGRDTMGKHVFEALLNGAMICPHDMKADGLTCIAERIVQEGITVCKFFPTGFRNFVDGLSGGSILTRCV
jgi:non-ribosomal peptide synthetase component F